MKALTAISKINQKGILLVYPIHNAKEPRSLWGELFPRTKMRWEWDAGGDRKVSDLWILREELSRSNKVVYTKWYQGRATFFSLKLYICCLRLMMEHDNFQASLSGSAQQVLEVLNESSPRSTKQLKRATDLVGRDMESKYQRSLKSLFHRFLIVGYGEVDEGAFPSLALGASQLLFEDLWSQAEKLSLEAAMKQLDQAMPKGSLFRKFWDRQWNLMKI